MFAGVRLETVALVAAQHDAHAGQQVDHRGDVLQIGHVADAQRIVGQQRRGEDRQGRVLGTGDADLPVEAHPAGNDQLVHDASCFIAEI
jgi:hypothetical protein